MGRVSEIERPADALAEALIRAYERCRGGRALFTPDALFDINVPTWRFQVRGSDAFFDWLRRYAPEGYRLTLLRAAPTASGFVAEVEGEYAHHGEDLYFRNLLLCEVSDGRIAELTFYCTGDWDAETRARQRHEAPMIRP